VGEAARPPARPPPPARAHGRTHTRLPRPCMHACEPIGCTRWGPRHTPHTPGRRPWPARRPWRRQRLSRLYLQPQPPHPLRRSPQGRPRLAGQRRGVGAVAAAVPHAAADGRRPARGAPLEPPSGLSCARAAQPRARQGAFCRPQEQRGPAARRGRRRLGRGRHGRGLGAGPDGGGERRRRRRRGGEGERRFRQAGRSAAAAAPALRFCACPAAPAAARAAPAAARPKAAAGGRGPAKRGS
jgi:hypothetical protein